MEYDYENDLAIDPSTLDEDWMRQPGMYMKYARAKADAVAKRDRIWEQLKVCRSRLIAEASADPSIVPGGKATAVVLEAYYRMHPDHMALKDQLVEADHEVNLYDGAVMAFSHRRSALEDTVRLMLGEYWAGPQTPRDIPGGKRAVDMEAKAAAATADDQRSKLRTRRQRSK